MASPIPCCAPVTSATLPANRIAVLPHRMAARLMNPSTNNRLERSAELAEGNAGEHASALLYGYHRLGIAPNLRRFAQSHQKHDALAGGVWREEARHLVVEEGQAAGSEPLSVSGEIQLATDDTGLQLCRTIPTIAEALDNGRQVRKEEYVCASIRRDFLRETQVTRLPPERPTSEQLQRLEVLPKHVGSVWQIIHGVDDEIEVVQRYTRRVEKIRRNPTCGAMPNRRE